MAAETTSDVFSPFRFQVPKPLSGMSLTPEEEGDRRGCCSRRAVQLLAMARMREEVFIFGLVMYMNEGMSDMYEYIKTTCGCGVAISNGKR